MKSSAAALAVVMTLAAASLTEAQTENLKAAIEAQNKKFGAAVAASRGSCLLTAEEVDGHGDTAYEVGAYSVRDGKGMELERGKYLVVWKRQQGQWKLHRDIWNSNGPPPQK